MANTATATQIVAVMGQKKTTPGKVVFKEEPDSPHFQATGVPLDIYIPKKSSKDFLGDPSIITLLIEPGDQVHS